MKIVTVLLTTVLACILFHTNAQAMYCPAELMCVEQDLFRDLRRAHYIDPSIRPIRGWELEAIRIITRDSNSKTPIDYIWVSDRELALGWAHFTAQTDKLDLGFEWPEEINFCGVPDPTVRLGLLTYLYSDVSAPVQLRAWRRLNNYSIPIAIEHGLRGDELTAVAIMANSGAVLPIRYGTSCEWNICCMLELYVDSRPDSLHRRTRVNMLNIECDN